MRIGGSRSTILSKEEPRIMPAKKLVIPAFKSERQEAAWWEKHRASVEADLRAAMRDNKTLSLADVLSHARQKRELRPVTIRLPSEDIAAARRLANDKGIGYQTSSFSCARCFKKKLAATCAGPEGEITHGSSHGRSPIHGDERDLLQRRPTAFSIRLPFPRRYLLDGGAGGRRFGEVLRVDGVHLRELVDIVEVHVGRHGL
jgi:predicted DNA binding CopG/RHH family protein